MQTTTVMRHCLHVATRRGTVRHKAKLLRLTHRPTNYLTSEARINRTLHLRSIDVPQSRTKMEIDENVHPDRAKSNTASEMSLLQRRLNATTDGLSHDTTFLVGVIIIRKEGNNHGSETGHLLVLKRAAEDDQFPNMWCVPGGHIDDNETVWRAIQRETFEETGLHVKEAIAELEPMSWPSATGHPNVQLNFVVTVESDAMITLNLEEHSEWTWADRADIANLACTENMREVMNNALSIRI